jgi:hypothetical protein
MIGVIGLIIGAGMLWPLLPDNAVSHAAWGVLLIAAAIFLIIPRRWRTPDSR